MGHDARRKGIRDDARTWERLLHTGHRARGAWPAALESTAVDVGAPVEPPHRRTSGLWKHSVRKADDSRTARMAAKPNLARSA